MKISQIKKGLILISIASGTLAIGCELIVDFDRTKIPVEIQEASIPDATTPTEGGVDAAGDQQSPGDANDGSTADADGGATSSDAADAADGDGG